MSWLLRVARHEGSTRSLGILRIFLPLLVWGEYGSHLALFGAAHPTLRWLGPALLCAAGLMAAGVATPLSGPMTAVGLGTLYFHFGLGLDMRALFVHAHSYLLMVAVTLVALGPSGRSLSADRWWALRRGRAAAERGPLWTLALLRLQLSAVYFWGAFDKTNAAFLSGSRLQQIFAHHHGTYEGVPLPAFDEAMVAAAVLTVALEYALAFGLWIAPARRFLVPAGIVFHALVFVTLPVGTFSATTCLLYLAFYPVDDVHRGLDRLLGPSDESGAVRRPAGAP